MSYMRIENGPSFARRMMDVPEYAAIGGGGAASILALVGIINPALLVPSLSVMVLGGTSLAVSEAIFPKNRSVRS